MSDDPLRAKAEAIANDLFWIVDDKAVQIIHKHLLEMEEERRYDDGKAAVPGMQSQSAAQREVAT